MPRKIVWERSFVFWTFIAHGNLARKSDMQATAACTGYSNFSWRRNRCRSVAKLCLFSRSLQLFSLKWTDGMEGRVDREGRSSIFFAPRLTTIPSLPSLLPLTSASSALPAFSKRPWSFLCYLCGTISSMNSNPCKRPDGWLTRESDIDGWVGRGEVSQ